MVAEVKSDFVESLFLTIKCEANFLLGYTLKKARKCTESFKNTISRFLMPF
jgi:hypothetical protein